VAVAGLKTAVALTNKKEKVSRQQRKFAPAQKTRVLNKEETVFTHESVS
jgi:hypothetical protein